MENKILGDAMVNRQVVLDTVKKMVESGIEESVVEKTLKDIGLSKKDIEDYIKEAKASAKAGIAKPQATSFMEPSAAHDAIALKTAEKVKEQLAEQREEQELKDSTLNAAMDEHGEKIEELHDSVSELHEKIDGFSSRLSDPELLKQVAELNKRISDFQSQLSDLKSLANANKTVLEKILEANRQILNKL